MKSVVLTLAFVLTIGALCGPSAADSPEASATPQHFWRGKDWGWKGYYRFGDTCVAWPVGLQVQCVIDWVNNQMANQTNNAPGSTCASMPPVDQRQCIIDWVIQLQQKLYPGLIGGCAGVAPVNQLACIINFVLQIQGNPNIVVGNTCASYPPGQPRQDCINQWVDEQKCKNSTLLGCSCASRGPANVQQCVNDWVIQQQKAQNPNGVGGCDSVPPTAVQDCVNTWVLQQQAQSPYNPSPFPCSRWRDRKYKRYCRNACIIGQQMQDAKGDASKTCGKINPSKQEEVQACINAYAKTAGYNRC